MAEKRINEDPRVTDTVIFEIETPDVDGCFLDNPYKVDKITVYYVERDFLGDNFGEYETIKYNDDLLERTKEADEVACADPTEANLLAARQLREELETTAQRQTYYYKDAMMVHSIGSSSEPVWLSTDEENALIERVEEDEDGNALIGKFRYEWNPNGRIREGDYFVCWTWTPNPAGESLSDHQQFTMFGDPRAVSAIPTHITPDEKYETILEKYLPEMYKMALTDEDITPHTTDKLNKAVAKGFKFIEDLSNQLIDLYDANALHESMLVYLSNLFNLRLKSSDPTLWRRQIKEAISLFKKKGTEAGLEMAFAQAGMTLNKVTRLWQVVSSYTWIESFKVIDSPTFWLSKNIITPIDEDNFGLWIRREGEDEYTEYSSSHVEFNSTTCEFGTDMTWIGDELSSNPVRLYSGDTIKVLYQYAAIPSGQQSLEDYIRELPLSDQRDETAQEYPPKNWNVKVIEEDDPLFSLVVPVRTPFHEPIVFGKVRTEFPYSENIYNMEEYNGSTRDSIDPCMIDKGFIDPCGGSISSKYSVDIAVSHLSDDRLEEVRDILREYTPFHAVVHNINFQGEFDEFVSSPVEDFEFLVKFNHTEYVLSGNGNPFFHRVMPDGMGSLAVTRDQLASQATLVATSNGTGFNNSINIITPQVTLSNLGIIPGFHVLEVLAPSPNSGEYLLGTVSGETGEVESGPLMEPLDESEFTFRLSNILYQTPVAKIYQDDVFVFEADEDFVELGVKTLWDVDNTPDYSGDTWTVLISAYSGTAYEILDIIDGKLLLYDPDRTLPTSNTTGITYTLFDDNSDEKAGATDASLTVQRRGRVDLNDPSIVSLTEYVKAGYFAVYGGDEYQVQGLVGEQFYIADYSDGDATGVSVEIRKRLVAQDTGFFNYGSMRLECLVDHEANLGITNGRNPPTVDPDEITENNLRKENFLVKIEEDYYKISEIDAEVITLDGLPQSWGTTDSGGTLVEYEILWFEKDTVESQLTVFDLLDRRGKDPIIREIVNSTMPSEVAVVALMMPSGSLISDNVQQDEGVSFNIQYLNGGSEEGEI